MDVTRRGWLGLASAAGAAALAAPLRARPDRTILTAGKRNYGPALERIRAFAAAELADKGFPGMQLALVGPEGFSAAFAVGWADIDRRIPASPEQLFQIGSIAKSLVALCLFVLAGQGKVNLDARAQDLLPDHPLPAEPITVTQLLDHSSGLPSGARPFPSVPGGRLWTGFTPGSRHSYCNLGYGLLGAIIERASGMTCGRAVEALVLRPLGMTSSEPVIRIADRSRYATGYVRAREDVPWLPRAQLAQAQWIDTDFPAGAVAATATDMARYLDYLVALGRGRGAPLLSDPLAQRFRTPTIDAGEYGKGAGYGNGLISIPIGGQPSFGHTGGMPAFSSFFLVQPEAGIGGYASVNVGGMAGYRPREVVEYACEILGGAAGGRPLPEVRQPKPDAALKDPARFTGRWIGTDGRDTVVSEHGGALRVARGGLQRPLRQTADRRFTTDHPSLAPYILIFSEQEPGMLRIGDQLYGRDGAPPKQPVNPRLAKLAGVYYDPASWNPRINVHALGDTLYAGIAPLKEAADGSWRSASPNGPTERLWFEHPVDGRPQQLNLSGIVYQRVHDRTL